MKGRLRGTWLAAGAAILIAAVAVLVAVLIPGMRVITDARSGG